MPSTTSTRDRKVDQVTQDLIIVVTTTSPGRITSDVFTPDGWTQVDSDPYGPVAGEWTRLTDARLAA